MEGATKVKEEERRWGVNKESSRILVEVATAYAITKVFLPARIVASVWATPWFARVVVGRVGGGVGRYFVKGASTGATTAGKGSKVAGTGSSVIRKSTGKP